MDVLLSERFLLEYIIWTGISGLSQLLPDIGRVSVVYGRFEK